MKVSCKRPSGHQCVYLQKCSTLVVARQGFASALVNLLATVKHCDDCTNDLDHAYREARLSYASKGWHFIVLMALVALYAGMGIRALQARLLPYQPRQVWRSPSAAQAARRSCPPKICLSGC